MKRFYCVYKLKNVFFCMAMLLTVSVIKAQQVVIVGTGTTGNTSSTYPAPLQDSYEGSRAQYLYTAVELMAAGMSPGTLTDIAFDVTALNSAGLIEQYKLTIGSTSASSLNAATWEPLSSSQSYGPADYRPVNGVNTFHLATPFIWNGIDNIIVEVCNGSLLSASGSYFSGNPTVLWTTGLAFNASHTYVKDDAGNLCGTTEVVNSGMQTSRPDIRFTYTPVAACTAMPALGNVTATSMVVCAGAKDTLAVTGAAAIAGVTYQWQSSADNSDWKNIPGAVLGGLTLNISATTYYRMVATCKASGEIFTSAGIKITASNFVSGTYTINKNAPLNTAPGGNFTSFNEAYNFLKCGINGPVVFNVVSGSGAYTEQLIMRSIAGVSATNTITFNGNGETISYASANSEERAVIKLNGASYVNFNNLVIKATGNTTAQYGFTVHLTGAASNNTFSGCSIFTDTTTTSQNYAGLVISSTGSSATVTGDNAQCNNNVFSNNVIYGGYYGVAMVASTATVNANNIFRGNSIRNFYSYGMYIMGSYGALIDSNVISRPTRTSVTTFYGIYVTTLTNKMVISRNTITNPFGGSPSNTSSFNGIYFSGVNATIGVENRIYNNLIYNLTGSATCYGIYNSSSNNMYCYFNTLSMDGAPPASATYYSTRGLYTSGQVDGLVFVNNIITISRTGLSAKHAIYITASSGSMICNNNDFYVSSVAGANYTGYFAANMATLADWRLATGQDANSVAVDPLYANLPAGNLQPISAAIDNIGVPFGTVNSDITGASRSTTTPDIGAYEFVPTPCVTPPTAGTTTASKINTCIGSSVALSLTGNSIGASQTYQWQSAATDNAGSYVNLGNVKNGPDTTITISSALMYYRVAISCGGNTVYSVPVKITASTTFPAGTYQINATVATTPNVTYKTFTEAGAALACGIEGAVVFNVVSAIYNEHLVLEKIPGTSSVNTITFNGNGSTLKYSASDAADMAVIKLRGADHVIVNDLLINATGSVYGCGVQLANDADSNTIRNCTITIPATANTTTFAGIVISADESNPIALGNTLCDGNVFDNNSISGGYYSITALGSVTAFINNNSFTNNTLTDFYQYGVYISYTGNTHLVGNNISRPLRTTVGNYYGIYISGNSTGLIIAGNRLFNPFGGNKASTSTMYGIYLSSCIGTAGAENQVINNLMHHVNGNGSEYGIYNTGSANVHYCHNTVSLDSTAATSTSTTVGFYQSTNAGPVDFKNNIIRITRGGSGTKYVTYWFAGQGSLRKNDYYVNCPSSTNYIGYNASTFTQVATLEQWQAMGMDSGTITIDPLFTAPEAPDYNFLPAAWPLNDAGDPAGVATDINGVARSAVHPDMGAYEFTPAAAACTSPPTPGTATVTPASGICMKAVITLNLAAQSTGIYQTYLWQTSFTANGPWVNISDTLYEPLLVTKATNSSYFRCVVTCSGNTAYSQPAHVSMGEPLSGTYTINKATATTYVPGVTGGNFNSFANAVATLSCAGINGPVYFDVAAGTYTEQVSIPYIYGASNNSRITFRSVTGNAADVTLTYASSLSTANYTMKIDSASYVTIDALTLKSTGATYSRAVEMAGNASYDSIIHCIITAPVSASASNTAMAVIYANGLTGANQVIKGNTISNGSYGIYWNNTYSTIGVNTNHVIKSNIISGAYSYAVYTNYSSRISIDSNTITITAPVSTTMYGIYAGYADTACHMAGNSINISGINAATTVYGMRLYYCRSGQTGPGIISGNTIMATVNNAGSIYGLYNEASVYCNAINNVISINTTHATSYGLYNSACYYPNYYNNSVLNSSASLTNGYAAYFSGNNATRAEMRNNIFANTGGGKAIGFSQDNLAGSDYNVLYTSGATLGTSGSIVYANLDTLRKGANIELNSIVYKPAFISETDLRPNTANDSVWAIHGRGVQIIGNNFDFNNNLRPTTLTEGVPDMGAYEFAPVAQPISLTAIPAAPVANSIQTFMLGTDTVAKITWKAVVPAAVSMKRFSGVAPPALPAATAYMYFYTQVDAGAGSYVYDMQQFYVDSWQGFVPDQQYLKLAKTDDTGNWGTSSSGTTDAVKKVMTDTALTGLHLFTGVADTTAPVVGLPPADSSNSGTSFWVGYMQHEGFSATGSSANAQDMIIYMSTAAQPAHVTIKISGTGWVKNYYIPANTVIPSDAIPKTGVYDARLLTEGVYNRGIHITSDVPVVAYAHIFNSQNSGATMLLPEGTYGYDYYVLGARQSYSTSTYAAVNIVAAYDGTVVEITPSGTSLSGHQAGVPYAVSLKKGEVYQLLGAIKPASTAYSTAEGFDLTGTRVRSLAGADGKCYPFALFSGSSRTGIDCSNGWTAGSGDNIIQQNLPYQAWGTKYLTAPMSFGSAANYLMTNLYRIAVKDPSTVVKVNGTVLTGLINNYYYQYSSSTPDYIEADKPVMVAQLEGSNANCGAPATEDGDPELIFISPVEQGVKKAAFYRNTVTSIKTNYLTLTIPTGGLASLLIDNTPNNWDYMTNAALPGYTVVVKRWIAEKAQGTVQSDSAFTGITYGLGTYESYGFNLGTLVKSISLSGGVNNTLSNTSGATVDTTCVNAPFRLNITTSVKAAAIAWNVSKVNHITPGNSVVQNNPVPVAITGSGGYTRYRYSLDQDFAFTAKGTYYIPVVITNDSIGSCDNTLETILTIVVTDALHTDYQFSSPGCLNDSVRFSSGSTTLEGTPVYRWIWNMGDGTSDNIQKPVKKYAAAGSYPVRLRMVIDNGCVADTVKEIEINQVPAISLVKDTIIFCPAGKVTFNVDTPVPGVAYNWYNDAVSGAAVYTGETYSLTSLTGKQVVYVAATAATGCSSGRLLAVALPAPVLTVPAITSDSISTNSIRFRWTPVSNALGYLVSVDGGTNWIVPSSGATGVTHIVTGLLPATSVTLLVKVIDAYGCKDMVSAPFEATTYPDKIFIPNAFTPNGDGLNDVLQVYGRGIKGLRLMIFNQWGEKVFEASNAAVTWDGSYHGKALASGVYMYVCKAIMENNAVVEKKGSINLIR